MQSMSQVETAVGDGEEEEHVEKLVESNGLRWFMLAIYGGISFCNGMLWITFSPITTFTEDFFDIDANLVNLLSVVYMILYIPGSFFASWLYKHYGCRNTLVFAAVGNALSAWTRVIAVAQPHNGYAFLLLGQCIGSWVQPCLLNAPAKITAVWFTLKQRDVATAVATSLNPLGVAIGTLVPSFFVDDTSGGMAHLLILEAAICSVTCLVGCIFFREEPDRPPSHSALHRRRSRNLFLLRSQSVQGSTDPLLVESGAPGETAAADEFSLSRQIMKCMGDYHFVVLFISVGVGLGIFNAMTTLIEQLVRNHGYSQSDASLFGSSMLIMGLIGAGICGVVLDRYHIYNTALKISSISGTAFLLLILLSLRPDNFAMLMVWFACLGLSMLPAALIAVNCAVECTFPVQEEVSTGLFMSAGQIVGIVLTLVLGWMLDNQASTYSLELQQPSGLTIVAASATCAATSLLYNGPYKRFDAEV